MSGPATKASHRATTSSRTPGRINRGTVRVEARALVQCPDCGAMTFDSDHPHAPHFRDGVLVDCIGRAIIVRATR